MNEIRRIRYMLAAAALTAALCSLAPLGAAAQRRAPAEPDGGTAGWAPVSAGPRFGYDQNATASVVGVQVHVPVLRSGKLELMPNADITFVSRLREYELNVEGVFVTGGRNGGLYGGGGLALRNTIYGVDPSSPRETRRGYSVVLGARTGLAGPFSTQAEFRWVFLHDTDFGPRVLTLGINFPLWGRRGRAGGGF